MNRSIAIAVLCIGIAATGSPQNSPGKQSDKAQSNPSPAATKIEDSTPNTEADGTNQKTPEPHSGIEWSNWALVAVGIVGVGAALLTLRAIKQQTDLQAAAYTQSIKIERWETTATRDGEMLIGFDVVNVSEFPLTMKSANIAHAGYPAFQSTNEVFLPPHTPYRINLATQITDAQFDLWDKAILPISLHGDFCSVGVLKSFISQSFEGLLITGKGQTPYFQYQISMVPAEKTKNNQKTK